MAFRTLTIAIPAVSFAIPTVTICFRRLTAAVPKVTTGFRPFTIVIPAATMAFRTLTIAFPAVTICFRTFTIAVPKGTIGFRSMNYAGRGHDLSTPACFSLVPEPAGRNEHRSFRRRNVGVSHGATKNTEYVATNEYISLPRGRIGHKNIPQGEFQTFVDLVLVNSGLICLDHILPSIQYHICL